MAKKQASYADYEVIVEDSGKITVKQSGRVLDNAKGGLREIAAAVGFAIEPKWNTQQAGSKLVDFLKNAPVAAAPAAPKPEPVAPKPQAAAPAQKKNEIPKNNEELTPEEMKQLDEILRRLDALEARLAKLEKVPAGAPAAAKSDNSALHIVAEHSAQSLGSHQFNSSGKLVFNISIWGNMLNPDHKDLLDSRLNEWARWRESINNGDFSNGISKCSIFCQPITELSDGHFYTFSYIGNTLREVKAFATLIGYPIPDKAKTDTLAAAIVRDRGANGWCVAEGQALKSTGAVYRYTKLTKQEILNKIKRDSEYARDSFIFDEPDVEGKSEKELVEAYYNFFNTAKPRPLPSKDEILRQFDETLRIEKLKLKG